MDHKVPLSEVVLGMVRAAKGHKGPEWEEIAAMGGAVQVKIQQKKYLQPQKRICSITFHVNLPEFPSRLDLHPWGWGLLELSQLVQVLLSFENSNNITIHLSTLRAQSNFAES